MTITGTAKFQTWPLANDYVLLVVTTPHSVTLANRRGTKKFLAQIDDAYNNGTLAHLVEQDAKLKKDTVSFPTKVAYIPGGDKLWITSADHTTKKVISAAFNRHGDEIAGFISREAMTGEATTASLREMPELRKPWVLFPAGMGLLMAVLLVAVRIVAGLFGEEGRRPMLAEAARNIPLVVVIGIAVALLALGAYQALRRSRSDQAIWIYT